MYGIKGQEKTSARSSSSILTVHVIQCLCSQLYVHNFKVFIVSPLCVVNITMITVSSPR